MKYRFCSLRYFLLFLSSLEVSYKLISDVLNSSQIPDFVFRYEVEKRTSHLGAAFHPFGEE